jgi:hypothetical protein
VSVKIFISCVTDEFRAYRDQLRTDLTRHNVEVKVQEDFKDLGGATVENDDVYIRECNVVIHLVGDMTGGVTQPASTTAVLAKYPDLKERFPPLRELLERGEDISYTQWEAWLALYHGKPLLIAQAADGAQGRGPDFAPTEASRAAQRAHLDRLRAVERFPGKQFGFGSVDELAKQIAYTTILDLLAEERGKAQATAHGANSFRYIALGGGLLVLLITPWLGEQWTRMLDNPLAGLLALAVAGGGFTLALVWSRYFGLLGASDGPVGSRDRMGYDVLRESLATGGPATHLYARRLEAFLNRVDRFFNDAGMVDQTLFPHAFGLRTPAPLWTPPAFDRCLLLALVYPIATVFVMWAVSGHVGPAEEVLGLPRAFSWHMRGLAVTATGFNTFAYWRLIHTSGWMRLVWLTVAFAVAVGYAFAYADAAAFVGAGAFADAFAGAFAVAGAFAGAVAIAFAGAVAFAGALAVAVADAVAVASAGAVTFAAAVAFAGVVAFAGAVAWLSDAARNQRQGGFLLSFFIVMSLGCLVAAHSLSSFPHWDRSGPLLLFLGLLTLLNAPFDWASLGLTRALLRRGLELKGWWPFFLALADAVAAAVIIALLALTMVIGVQTFDALAVHGGGKAVLPLTPLFDGIAAHPELPEYWWVYALLLSTMIPSLINLAIGGTALMRAVPGLPQALLHFMPAAGGVPTYDRAWIATVLTLQAALGAILGVAVQALVAWGLIFHAMPAAGLGLLDLARDLAALDLPARAIAWFAGL